MKKPYKLLYKARRGIRKFLKSTARKKKYGLKKAAYQKYLNVTRRTAIGKGKEFKIFKKSPFSHEKPLPPKPKLSPFVLYLLTVSDLFSKKQFNQFSNGHLFIPKCFSLIENYEESFDFLKRLLIILEKCKAEEIILDYINCERIDVDASVCMDILLAEFIPYITHCRKIGHKVFKKGVNPRNINNDHVRKVLFSIGAYRNLKGIRIKYPDVLDLPVLINNHDHPDVWGKSEVDLTNIVEYIKSCLKRLNRELTSDAEKEFYNVIGEIMSNALEHGTMPHSYAIGFFQETHNEEEHFGVFNFSIFNFGNTIYQTFNKSDCPNKKAVEQMKNLSEVYTKKGFFRSPKFKEETLWTLYALQEGVTSKEKKRGNGSIQYIDNFFKLKGDLHKDNISSMVILSGNTRIVFDGTYKIIEKEKEGERRRYKMITFNNSNEIHDSPDQKFVTFVPHFFPGTMISARILIKFDNTNEQSNEQ
jgi:hypothetical protein